MDAGSDRSCSGVCCRVSKPLESLFTGQDEAMRYVVAVCSGDPSEPAPSYFAALDQAWSAWHELDDQWKPFAAVRCKTPNGRGGYYSPRIDRQGHVLGV